MSQHDLDVANGSGSTVRSDINSGLQALGSLQSGASAPGTTYAYELWADTTNAVLKQRNAANSAWIVRSTLNEDRVQSKATGFTAGLTDLGVTFLCTSALTVAFAAAATLGDGWFCYLKNTSGGTVTLDPDSTEQVDGATTTTVGSGASCMVWCDGSAFYTLLTTSSSSSSAGDNGQLLHNLSLAAAVATNALTISLKTRSGADCSAGDYARIAFRSSTATSGVYNLRDVTASLSVTLSAGSTLGFTNSESGRIWVGAIDNAGTVELCAFRALSGTSIKGFADHQLVTTTAEGGAGAADSAQTLYSTSARSAVPFRLLGFIEVQTGSTAGNWSNAPSKIQVIQTGMPRPGDPVQTQVASSASMSTGTTAMPYDDTIPQNTEGDQFLTQAITPASALNVLRLEAHAYGSHSAAAPNATSIALFQDSTADALSAASVVSQGAASIMTLPLFHRMVAGTGSSTTFNVRIGGNTGSTFTFNGSGGARKMGGVMTSWLRIEELMA